MPQCRQFARKELLYNIFAGKDQYSMTVHVGTNKKFIFVVRAH